MHCCNRVAASNDENPIGEQCCFNVPSLMTGARFSRLSLPHPVAQGVCEAVDLDSAAKIDWVSILTGLMGVRKSGFNQGKGPAAFNHNFDSVEFGCTHH